MELVRKVHKDHKDPGVELDRKVHKVRSVTQGHRAQGDHKDRKDQVAQVAAQDRKVRKDPGVELDRKDRKDQLGLALQLMPQMIQQPMHHFIRYLLHRLVLTKLPQHQQLS